MSDGVPTARRGDGPFGVGLFVAALLPRLYVALAWGGEAVWDGHYYDFGARRIAAGFGYSDDLMMGGALKWHPWCHYPVGYSAFLGFFYALFGAKPVVAAAVNAGVGAALAVMTWLLGREGLSPLRARAAGVLVAAHPGLILYAGLHMTEPLAALGTVAAFWLATRRASPRVALVAGSLVLGLSALVRPQALLCAPFLGALSPLARASSRGRHLLARAAFAVVACALTLVPIAPWTARNCRVMDGCALVSTNGGWNLAIGAFPRATGRFETLRSSDGCREVTGQVQQDRCWLRYGLEQIEAAPARWLGLIPAKLGFTFDHESFPVEYLHEARPEAWPEDRRVASRDALTIVHRLFVCAAALACVAFGAKGRGAVAQGALLAVALGLGWVAFGGAVPHFWPLVLFTAVVPWLPVAGRPPWPPALLLPVVLLSTTVVAHAIFFGEDRYHMVVVPVFALLAAAALRRPAPREAQARP